MNLLIVDDEYMQYKASKPKSISFGLILNIFTVPTVCSNH